MGQALDLPFIQISLGGQNDGEILIGHGYTYNAAQPGMIVKKMVEAGNARCIMYFDELDKASTKQGSITNELFSILIHMTDPSTNGDFQDRFFQEISFPLNKVLFVFSYNDASLIDRILLDRLIKIRVDPYTMSDKMEIAKKFLIKEYTDLLKLNIEFTDSAIEYIIDEYTHEAGVRELKRKIEKLFLKMNLDKIYGKDIFENETDSTNIISIDKDLVIKYLDKPELHIKEVHKVDRIGVINGLYATESGQGGIVPIQIYHNHTGAEKKFSLKLTGSQGKVMKESIVSACTTALDIVKETVRKDFFKDRPYGFHIHTPSGATPKDGPSAGCAFAVAFVSIILHKKIRHDVGITGEIELTGQITKIGGLTYKLIGAKKAGIKLVLVSQENEEDVNKIKKDNPHLICDHFQVKLVENLRDVLSLAIVDFNMEDLS